MTKNYYKFFFLVMVLRRIRCRFILSFIFYWKIFYETATTIFNNIVLFCDNIKIISMKNPIIDNYYIIIFVRNY